ncbi:RDD family protein [Permianibacter sp. IMCC34836]|uniref:RDD family protein n=1 Tax=Permianibacter fluminis TaxID=2738515 RepID=UPI00155549AF|nr:RDD family protein [Permianibacter fluminis]NQD38455.1 RDD family protein [Permianibacter fluminis]
MLDGRLSLTTPEGVRLLLTPAGPAIRAAAWALDFIVWLVIAFFGIWIFSGSKLGAGVIGLILFVSYWGYPVICEVYFRGRSIGKRAFGLEVLRADGLPVGWRESALRNLIAVADFLPMLYASGLLCMLLDRRFRRLGDIVAGTQVVYHEKLPARSQFTDVQPLATSYPLTPEQQRILIGLFEREKKLPVERMQELASIAEPITGLTGAASLAELRGIAAGLTQ